MRGCACWPSRVVVHAGLHALLRALAFTHCCSCWPSRAVACAGLHALSRALAFALPALSWRKNFLSWPALLRPKILCHNRDSSDLGQQCRDINLLCHDILSLALENPVATYFSLPWANSVAIQTSSVTTYFFLALSQLYHNTRKAMSRHRARRLYRDQELLVTTNKRLFQAKTCRDRELLS